MPLWGGLIAGGASLIGGGLGWFGAQKAASQQAASFQKAQQMAQPFVDSGTNALGIINRLIGSTGTGPGNAGAAAPDYSSFFNSPDYQWAKQQGTQATEHVLSAQGNLLSGGGLAALTNYDQGLASQQYGNYFGRLMQVAGLGSGALGTLNSAITGQGQAQASGTVGGVNALTGALGGVGTAANSYASNTMLMNMWKQMQGNNNYGSAYQVAGNPTSLNPSGYGGGATTGWNMDLGGGGSWS